MDFINNGTGRPKPKAGYRCKICGQEGGKAESHWYQLCPYKGKTSDKRMFNPPRKGYFCKFCHKPGGEFDSHWFQQCPYRHKYEGVQVPHPLKLRAVNTAGMMNLLTPQALTAQTASVAVNLGLVPPGHPDTVAQPSNVANTGLGIFMYPNNVFTGQTVTANNTTQQPFHNVQQLQQLQQAQQQQVALLQQQLLAHQQQTFQQNQGYHSANYPENLLVNKNGEGNLGSTIPGGASQHGQFQVHPETIHKVNNENVNTAERLLTEITTRTENISFADLQAKNVPHNAESSQN